MHYTWNVSAKQYTILSNVKVHVYALEYCVYSICCSDTCTSTAVTNHNTVHTHCTSHELKSHCSKPMLIQRQGHCHYFIIDFKSAHFRDEKNILSQFYCNQGIYSSRVLFHLTTAKSHIAVQFKYILPIHYKYDTMVVLFLV